MAVKLKAENLYKIFGNDPKKAIDLLKSGRNKGEIFETTGLTVGVQDISFEVGEAEIFVVMGLSGSGKSTLVHMLNGLIEPTSGTVSIDGQKVTAISDGDLRSIRRDKISMVFQHFALFPHKTVAENVAYGLKVKGVSAAERRRRAQAALQQVGLGQHAESLPDELSGGMQQRVGLARGLAAQTEVLLMDEPFSALDPLIRRDMQEELIELQRGLKKTIVFITHDLNEALVLGDRIAIMKDGRFVQVGTAEEIVGNPADDYVAAFTQDIDRSRVFTARSVAESPQTLDLTTDTAASAMQRMEALGRNALYVLDGERVAGLVAYRDLPAATRVNGTSLDGTLLRDYPEVKPGAQLYELYPLASQGLPIAVRDRTGRLEGVIEPEAVFAKLSAAPEADGREMPLERRVVETAS
jgi:glycine betaine/proline transport system ATP-binding protein